MWNFETIWPLLCTGKQKHVLSLRCPDDFIGSWEKPLISIVFSLVSIKIDKLFYPYM